MGPPIILRTFAILPLCAASAAFVAPHVAAAEKCAEITDSRKLESADYVVAYRTTPAPVPMGQHFTLEIVVCPRGTAHDPIRLDVDAHMPEHRHGMNYKVLVKPLGPGRYHAEGLMFHMPGRWELLFDVHGAGGPVRLTDSVILK